MPPAPPRYAAETEVPIAKSKAAIEALLMTHGATQYASGWDETHDKIQFQLFNQTIRFLLPRPDRNDRRFVRDRRGYTRTMAAQERAYDQANRQRWRALYLVIKAKLEAIQSGISIYEQEFLAYVVDPATDLTIGDMLVPQLQAGKGVPMLQASNPDWQSNVAPAGRVP